MPNTSSAIKALRQSKTRRARNAPKKQGMIDMSRNVKKLIAEGKKKEAEKLVSTAYAIYDKAAKSGYIKKNTAARKKSRLMKLFKK